jgi:methyl-accepting chemotaxis protein
MGKHFNELLLMLAELLKQIQLTSVQITDMVQGLSASSQEISATANEQAAAVKEIVSTIEDTNHLAKNISNRVEEVSRIATDTKGNVEDGVTAVQDNISKSNEIHDANSKTILGINFLSDKIKNIWDIVNIINSIADQTKIIAFNAELEASSAGEAGKNFQIVASEIRRLADSTVTSTNEIKIRIQEIERSSDALLLSSEQGTLQILQGKDLSQRMNKLFGDIALSSEVSSSSTQQIAVSIRQQVSSFEQILIAIKQISQGVDNFVVSTKSTSGTTENLRKMSTKLSAMLEKFEMAEE